MMAKQRDAELALARIVGTTPMQREAIPIMEGLIITGTGALLAMVMVTLTISYRAVALPMVPFPFVFAPSWGMLAACLAVMALITTAATLVPTLPAVPHRERRPGRSSREVSVGDQLMPDLAPGVEQHFMEGFGTGT